eukprot:2103940-Prymnesium_polylepis.1
MCIRDSISAARTAYGYGRGTRYSCSRYSSTYVLHKSAPSPSTERAGCSGRGDRDVYTNDHYSTNMEQ